MLSITTMPFEGLGVMAGLAILAMVQVWGDEARQPPEEPRPAGHIRCLVIGLVSAAVGLYCLLTGGGDSGAVNAQRLTLGATGMIVGAIFLAAAWRPR